MRFVSMLCSLACAVNCNAQDSKPDQKPRIVLAVPLAISSGVPTKLILRGLRLDELTSVTIVGTELKPEILSKGKTTVPANYDLQKVGDTTVEIKFTLPAETPSGTIQLVAVSAAGSSPPYDLLIAKPEELIAEKEPNDGFKTAQPIDVGKTIVGTIHDARNVDVFEWQAEAGEKLTITVLASQAGSLLDPVMTLYDAAGQVVTSSDDVDGRDPRIEIVITKSGSYYLTIQDANDAGGPHFSYLLKVRK